MKALRYEVMAANSLIGWTQGSVTKIVEYFVPEHKLAFNVSEGTLNVFRAEYPRLIGNPPPKTQEIELPDQLVRDLGWLIKLREELITRIGKLKFE
jgi:hypothetical protein